MVGIAEEPPRQRASRMEINAALASTG
jgi:hypothetical protein